MDGDAQEEEEEEVTGREGRRGEQQGEGKRRESTEKGVGEKESMNQKLLNKGGVMLTTRPILSWKNNAIVPMNWCRNVTAILFKRERPVSHQHYHHCRPTTVGNAPARL